MLLGKAKGTEPHSLSLAYWQNTGIIRLLFMFSTRLIFLIFSRGEKVWLLESHPPSNLPPFLLPLYLYRCPLYLYRGLFVSLMYCLV